MCYAGRLWVREGFGYRLVTKAYRWEHGLLGVLWRQYRLKVMLRRLRPLSLAAGHRERRSNEFPQIYSAILLAHSLVTYGRAVKFMFFSVFLMKGSSDLVVMPTPLFLTSCQKSDRGATRKKQSLQSMQKNQMPGLDLLKPQPREGFPSFGTTGALGSRVSNMKSTKGRDANRRAEVFWQSQIKTIHGTGKALTSMLSMGKPG